MLSCEGTSPLTFFFFFNFYFILFFNILLKVDRYRTSWWSSGYLPMWGTQGLDPWAGRILYTMGQLLLCASTTEPLL